MFIYPYVKYCNRFKGIFLVQKPAMLFIDLHNSTCMITQHPRPSP